MTQLRAGMVDCLDAPAWALPDTDLIDSLDAVHQLEQAVAAVKLHLVREVDARALPVRATSNGVTIQVYRPGGWRARACRVAGSRPCRTVSGV